MNVGLAPPRWPVTLLLSGGGIAWIGEAVLLQIFLETRSTIANAGIGHIIPHNNHGVIFYLSEQDENALHALAVSGTLLFVLAALRYLFDQRRKRGS